MRRFVSITCLLLLGSTATALAEDPAGAQPPPAAPPAYAPPVDGSAPAAAPMPPDAGADTPAANSIYAEGLGAGLAYSINYERMVVPELAVRIGFSYLSMSASVSDGSTTSTSSAAWLSFPITASYVGVRSGSSGLEMGGGVTLTYATGSASSSGGGLGVSASGSGLAPLGTVLIGYRLHPVGGGGFQFRVGVMALVGKGLSLSNPDPESIGILPWGYISMGASFG